MKKRLFAILFFALVLIFGLTSCEHLSQFVTPAACTEHEGGEATCTAGPVCSKCGETYGEPLGHKDEDKDHACDTCTDPMGEHKAADGSHNCDYCGEKVTQCADENPCDHKCDVCDETLSQCADTDPRDHKCDVCEAPMGEHAAATGSHNCGYCGEALTQCADADKNHKCDVCEAPMGNHAAATGSHN